MDSRSTAQAKPPANDLAFVSIDNQNWAWAIEAKVLRSAGSLAEYLKDVNDKFVNGIASPFIGDGGMIVTSDDDLASKIRWLRVHGGQQMYHHRWVGWNSRLDALQAAVLSIKLPHLDRWSQARGEHAATYDRLFEQAGLTASEDVRIPWRSSTGNHIFNQYIIRVPNRDAVKEHLVAQGIGCDIYYPLCLHQQECFAGLGYSDGDFPAAERAAAEVLALPVYPELTDAMQAYVAQSVLEAI